MCRVLVQMRGQLWSGSTRGGHTPLYLPIHAKFTMRILLVVIAVLLFGILVTVWNISQLRTMQENHLSGYRSGAEGVSAAGEESKPVLWLHAKRVKYQISCCFVPMRSYCTEKQCDGYNV